MSDANDAVYRRPTCWCDPKRPHVCEPEHYTDGTPCWCAPRIEKYPNADLVIHSRGN